MKTIAGCWPQTSGAPYFSIEFIGEKEEAEKKMREWVAKDWDEERINLPYFTSPVSELERNPDPQVGDSFYPKPGWDNFPHDAPCWFRGRKRLADTD